MDPMRIIELKETILADNDADADVLRGTLKQDKTFYVNIMSSPGAGKTTTILRTIANLKEQYRIGVMEADIDSDVDAKTVAAAGVEAIQLHTGGMCHLDADMSRQGLKEIGGKELDLVILENVGNLVCPAEFDAGSSLDVAILSVPEGDDKPLKYPLMFERCSAVIINKMDAMPVFDFDLDRASECIHMGNRRARIFPISAKTGEGVQEWCDWLKTQIDDWNAQRGKIVWQTFG